MKELIINQGRQFTSLEMAKVTGKKHNNILRDIRDEISLLGENIGQLIFEQTVYVDTHNRQQTMFVMHEKGWLQMGARYDAKTRYAIIDYAETRTPQTFSQALKLAYEQSLQIEQQQKQLQAAKEQMEANKPKVLFAETVKGSKNTILIREFAKILQKQGFDMGQNKLFAWLRENKYLMRNNEPYQQYMGMGLFEVIERTVGDADSTITVRTTKITGKGQTYFTEKILTQNNSQ